MHNDAIDWAAVEAGYRAGTVPLQQLAAQYGVSRAAIYKRAKQAGWARGGPRARTDKMRTARARAPEESAAEDTRATAARLHRLVRRLSRELERRLAGEATDPAILSAREGTAPILNALTRAAASLAALERDRDRRARLTREQTVNSNGEAADVLGAEAAWAEVERRLARLAAENGSGPLPV
jgi:hypothetical protein